MYEYSIYRISEEIARHYYRKSDLLYRFLKEYQSDTERLYLQAQYIYITQYISQALLESDIKKYVPTDVYYQFNRKQIEIYNKNKSITLQINNNCIHFRCESLHDAEDFLFPVLRIFEPFLFVVNHSLENYGWISPITKTKQYEENQVLYSSR